MLRVGEEAPQIEGKDQWGNLISLEKFLKKGPVVLFFYPRDFTTVCTKEACSFQDIYAELQEKGVEIIGISTDSHEKHQEFTSRFGLKYPLLADTDKRIAKKFGVTRWFTSMLKRATFVIGKDRKIKGVVRSELSAHAHVKGALDALK